METVNELQEERRVLYAKLSEKGLSAQDERSHKAAISKIDDRIFSLKNRVGHKKTDRAGNYKVIEPINPRFSGLSITQGERQVCTVYGKRNTEELTKEANLIAAAPDMLQALINIKDDLNIFNKINPSTLEHLNGVLKKATE